MDSVLITVNVSNFTNTVNCNQSLLPHTAFKKIKIKIPNSVTCSVRKNILKFMNLGLQQILTNLGYFVKSASAMHSITPFFMETTSLSVQACWMIVLLLVC